MLVHLEQALRPAAGVAGRGDQRPVFGLDGVVDLGVEAGGRDRARIPAERGGLTPALRRLLIRVFQGPRGVSGRGPWGRWGSPSAPPRSGTAARLPRPPPCRCR